MSQYDDRGKVALWRPQSDNPKAPWLKGKIVAHRDIREGEEIDLAIWKNQRDKDTQPVATGRVSDRENNEVPQESPAAGPVDDLDDDIPF